MILFAPTTCGSAARTSPSICSTTCAGARQLRSEPGLAPPRGGGGGATRMAPRSAAAATAATAATTPRRGGAAPYSYIDEATSAATAAGAGAGAPPASSCPVTRWTGGADGQKIERYLWIDLSAGPVAYGPVGSAEGVASEHSLPSVASLARRFSRPSELSSHLAVEIAALCATARQLLSPPAWWLPSRFYNTTRVAVVRIADVPRPTPLRGRRGGDQGERRVGQAHTDPESSARAACAGGQTVTVQSAHLPPSANLRVALAGANGRRIRSSGLTPTGRGAPQLWSGTMWTRRCSRAGCVASSTTFPASMGSSTAAATAAAMAAAAAAAAAAVAAAAAAAAEAAVATAGGASTKARRAARTRPRVLGRGERRRPASARRLAHRTALSGPGARRAEPIVAASRSGRRAPIQPRRRGRLQRRDGCDRECAAACRAAQRPVRRRRPLH